MAIMLGSLYKALIEPTEEHARHAAEEVAGYDSRLAAIDTKLAVLQALVGVAITLLLGVLWMAVRLSGDLAGVTATVTAIARKVGAP
jgi:hypothetical protein